MSGVLKLELSHGSARRWSWPRSVDKGIGTRGEASTSRGAPALSTHPGIPAGPVALPDLLPYRRIGARFRDTVQLTGDQEQHAALLVPVYCSLRITLRSQLMRVSPIRTAVYTSCLMPRGGGSFAGPAAALHGVTAWQK